jgi:fumarylacetoacetate (FAA) hydrolase family protein
VGCSPPADLQAVKASGVTFVASLLERGDRGARQGQPRAGRRGAARDPGHRGADLRGLKPGSPEAARVKDVLVAKGMWSQYLEVGIGPDAELFTKCPPMAAVGTGGPRRRAPRLGVEQPEPELVLAINRDGAVAAVTLGNDVNLRDVEGRSALLLGRAKDNNASCAMGPFFRLLDERFTLAARARSRPSRRWWRAPTASASRIGPRSPRSAAT